MHLGMKRARHNLGNCGRLFCARQDAMAAVEFALVLPVLLVMFLGTLEVGLALSVDRRLSLTVTSVADLVAREEKATTASVAGIMEVSKHLLHPYSTSKMKLSIMALRTELTDTTKGEVLWAYAYNGAAIPANCTHQTLKKDLLGPGVVAIAVQAYYDYQPLITKYFIKNNITFEDNAMMSPRLGTVVYNSNNTPCP